MFFAYTDPNNDLGTLMGQVIDRLTTEMDDAIGRQVPSPEPEDSDTFDVYAFACALLDRR